MAARRTRWPWDGVLVVGPASLVVDPREVEHLAASALAPWARGQRSSFVRIDALRVTGRRIPLRPGRRLVEELG